MDVYLKEDKMKKDLTEIVIIADRSGSMSDIIDEARGSINRLIEEQKAEPGEANFTFVMFDDTHELVRDRVDLKTVMDIGIGYYARGMTAMNDAIGKTINNIGCQLDSLSEEDRPSKVIFSIITDGMENSSKEFTSKQIADMIKHQQDKYGWEFIFFGANIDTAEIGDSLNILANNSINYTNTRFGVNEAYTKMSVKMSKFRQS